MHNEDEVRSMLAAGRCEVVFEKADGTERTLIGTRNYDILQKNFVPDPVEGKEAKTEPAGVVRVYDLKKNAWRSFRLDRLKTITTL